MERKEGLEHEFLGHGKFSGLHYKKISGRLLKGYTPKNIITRSFKNIILVLHEEQVEEAERTAQGQGWLVIE